MEELNSLVLVTNMLINTNGILLLENGEIFPSDYGVLEDNQPSFLEAKTIYLLMQNNVLVSRATRLQWLLDHLNTTVTPSQKLVSSYCIVPFTKMFNNQDNKIIFQVYRKTFSINVQVIL